MRPHFSPIMDGGSVQAGAGAKQAHSLHREPHFQCRSKYIRDKMDLINLSENVRMTKNVCARMSRVIELGSDIEYYK